jgi:hypothetical protein
MPEHTIKMPGGRWMTREEVLAYLGLPESQLKRLLAAGVITSRGRGSGRRYDSETVYAAGVLWHVLDGLLPEAKDVED